MANKLLDFPSYSSLPPKKPVPPTPSLGEVLSAQYGEASPFIPIWEQNKHYAAPTYDEGAADAVEAFIKSKPDLNDSEKLRLRNFGTSFKALKDNVEQINVSRARREIMSRVNGPTAFFTDPAFHIDLLMMVTPAAGPLALAKLFKAFRMKSAAEGFKRTGSRVLTGEGVGVKEAAKIGAVYGAASPLIIGTLNTLSADDPEEAYDEAAKTVVTTIAMTSIGAAAGGGLAKLFGRSVASDVPITDIDTGTTLDVAEAKLARSIKEAKERAKTPAGIKQAADEKKRSKQAIARKKKNKALSENYRSYLDDVSGDEAPVGVGFKNEKILKFVTGPVPTAFRNIITSNLPDAFKAAAVRLGGDLGLVSKANELGIASGMSVHLAKALRSKDWAKAETKINEAYQEVNPRRTQTFMGSQIFDFVEKTRKLIGKDSYTLGDWYELVGKTALRNTPIDQIDSEPLRNAVIAYREFITPYTKELEELGIINSKDLFVEKFLKASGKKGELISVTNKIIAANKRWMKREIDKLAMSAGEMEKIRLTELQGLMSLLDSAKTFDDLVALRPKLDLTKKMDDAMKTLSKSMRDLSDQIDSYKAYIDSFEAPDKSRVHFPIVYNRAAISTNRDAFEAIVREHFAENNTITILNEETLLFEKVELASDSVSVAERARKAVDTILGETDEDDIEMMMSGIGRGGMLGARRMNIPVEKIEDFIVTDIKDIMIAYSDRIGGRIEFHKAFKNPTTGRAQALEDILEQLRMAAKADGATDAEIDEGIKNFVSVYDMVVGTPLKNPDAIDNKLAEILRSLTNLTFLGRAGVAAVGDASTIFMDNDLATIGKVFLAPLSDEKPLSTNAKELRLMGDLLEISRGMAQVRFMEGMSSSPFVKSTWDKTNNAFYNLNGLNYVTMITKNAEALARGHTIIERAIKLANGKANKFETEFLARYMIDVDMAKKIAEQPFEKTKNGLIMPNSSQWADEGVKETFQGAIRAGVANRIITGTPADKPNMMNGFVYFRKETAEKFGLPIIEDPRVPNYVRYESGLMTLPFAFYTYTFGALTKITGNYAQGAVQNKAAHVAASLILGGLIVKVRTPSFVWDEMDAEDKVARAFDFSGLAAMHTDLVYRGLAMANEFGVDVEDFPLEPKFDSGVDPTGGALSVLGAPVDYGYGLATSIKDLTTGNFNEGAKDLINHIPVIGAMAFMGTIKDTLKALVPSD